MFEVAMKDTTECMNFTDVLLSASEFDIGLETVLNQSLRERLRFDTKVASVHGAVTPKGKSASRMGNF